MTSQPCHVVDFHQGDAGFAGRKSSYFERIVYAEGYEEFAGEV